MANNWTREQLIITFNLYCKIPFAKAVKTNPDVIRVAELIGRTPSAVAFKLGNFGSLDPELKKRGIGGLPNTSRLDREIWNEFHEDWERLSFASEELLATRSGRQMPVVPPTAEQFPQGLSRETSVKVRVNQAFFRQSVLGIYSGRCCITGIAIPELLVASHIVPWSVDPKNRTNPSNGLCLNSLHDRAFDCGLMTLTDDYRLQISSRVKSNATTDAFLLNYADYQISLPDKFLPAIDFIRYHRKSVFQPA